MKHPLTILIVVAALIVAACTAAEKAVARTALDVAREACMLFSAEQGTVKVACETEADLAPWLEHLLSARRAVLRPACPVAPSASAEAPTAVPSPESAPAGAAGAASGE